MRIFFPIIFTLFTIAGNSQGQADWWYFGNNAGIHFETGGPVAVNDGQISTSEGCASISDQNGNLLFYTDGSVVIDKNHVQMPNGTGLLGSSTSTHSGIIVPKPGSSTEFYIFTVDDAGVSGDGMYYSAVDLTLNSGDGDVVTTEKNVFLVDDTSEKVAAVKKSNGYWVVTHIAESNQFYTYEVTSAGVNTTPIISNTIWTPTGFGYGMAVSSIGNKLATVHFSTDSIHMFNVDGATGIVSADYKIGSTMGASLMYGLEFSPNAEILYMASYNSGDVRQFDLTAGNSAAISASEVVVGQSGSGGGQLQTGPDGKIYCARTGQQRLSVINDPNVLGTSCNWVDTAVVLTSNSVFGLPTFIQSFFSVSFSVSETCFGDTTFFALDTVDLDSANWNFGDPGSGGLNTATSFFPSHYYADTGFYEIRLIAFSDTNVDTSFQTVRVYPRQSIDLGADTLICRGTSLEFTAAQEFASFLWQDSTTADTFSTAGDTFIKVTVFGVCDTVSDSVNIIYDDTITFDLGPDTLLCGGNGFEIDGNLDPPNSVVWWNTGDSTATLLALTSDVYIMNAENACGAVSDTIEVSFIPIPNISLLPNDTINCFDKEIVLTHPNEDSTTYIWSDSSSKKTYTADTTETVWLAAFNECGTTIDTIHILFNGEIKSELGPDTVICEDDSVVLNAYSPGARYIWNTGDTADSIVSTSESMLYVVTVTEGFCSTIESKRVDLSEVFCPGIDCRLYTLNVFSPDGDGVNDIWRVRIDCEIYEYDLRIYNRWGQLVHQSSNSNFGWDGTINGEEAPVGVYFYDVQYKDNVAVDVDRFSYRGSLTLYR